MTDAHRTETLETGRNPAQKPRAKASAADKARDAVNSGIDTVRQQASAAADASAAAIENAPMTALVGAIAVGAVAAALIPATARELSTVGPYGSKVRGLLDDAFAAAKSAGQEQLTTRGLTGMAATAGVGQILGSVVKAVLAANSAADDSLKTGQSTADVPPATNTAPPPQAS